MQDETARCGMERYITSLSTFARNLQMSDPTTLMFEVLDQKLAKFLASQSMVEQGGQNGAVAFILERDIL